MNTMIQLNTRTDTCARHGEYLARNFLRDIWSKCPTCAQEADAAEKARAEAKAREAKLQAWQKRIGGAGIPDRFHDRTLSNFEAANPGQRRALAFAQQYADEFEQVIKTGRSALFVGQPGTGKTHLAVGIGMHLLREGRPVLFTTVMRAMRRIKDTWVKGSTETEGQAVAALVYPDLLILDEVGIQFGSEFEKNILFDVLNERYEKRRPTLLLSNLPLDQVRAYLGERVFDRLREDGGEYIAFEWESQRGKRKESLQ